MKGRFTDTKALCRIEQKKRLSEWCCLAVFSCVIGQSVNRKILQHEEIDYEKNKKESSFGIISAVNSSPVKWLWW